MISYLVNPTFAFVGSSTCMLAELELANWRAVRSYMYGEHVDEPTNANVGLIEG